MATDKKALGLRLKEIREDLGETSKRKFAISIKADPSYYTKAEKGEGLSDEYLDVIIQKYGYNKQWLWFGEGIKKNGVETPNKIRTPDNLINDANAGIQFNHKIKRVYVESFTSLY